VHGIRFVNDWLLAKHIRLWVFENRVPRKLLGPKMDEVAGDWTKLHYEELNDFCSSPGFRAI
jgi:hypothetical protein